MTIPLQAEIVYGPLDSRRFGRSLGINLLPSHRKVCNFDCVYCQYGESKTLRKIYFPSILEIKKSFEDLAPIHSRVDWIMIAGNGEPTLHPLFNQAITELLILRDRYFPNVPVGILSNSSTCYRANIQDALMKLQGRFMKLDAGYHHAWDRINRPFGGTRWSDILGGLYRLKETVLQSMFVTGSTDNTREDILEEWMRAVQYIRPKEVQIYSLDRPPKEEGLLPVACEILGKISQELTSRTGIPSFVF